VSIIDRNLVSGRNRIRQKGIVCQRERGPICCGRLRESTYQLTRSPDKLVFLPNVSTEYLQLSATLCELRLLVVRHERALSYISVQVEVGGAVHEMRGGPSEPACRGRLETTSSCAGKEPGW